jgi:hypothetical protein
MVLRLARWCGLPVASAARFWCPEFQVGLSPIEVILKRPERRRIGLALLCAISVVACSHRITVQLDELPRLAKYYETGEVRISQGDHEVTITQKHEPELRLFRDCGFWDMYTLSCFPLWKAEIETLRQDGDRYTFAHQPTLSLSGSVEETTIEATQILRVELELKDFMPKNWEPQFGVGMNMAGPAIMGAYSIQWLPAQWLAIELGGFGAPDLGGWAYTGLRVRPVSVGPVRFFVGGFVNTFGGQLCEPAEGDEAPVASTDGPDGDAAALDCSGSTSSLLVGPRIGLDWEFGMKRWMLTAEANLVRRVSGEGGIHPPGPEGEWVPWGGVSIWYMQGDRADPD